MNFIEKLASSSTKQTKKMPMCRLENVAFSRGYDHTWLFHRMCNNCACWLRDWQGVLEVLRPIPIGKPIAAAETFLEAGDELPSASRECPTCIGLNVGPETLRVKTKRWISSLSQSFAAVSVTVHEEELGIHRNSEKTHVRQENFCTVACTSDWTLLENIEVSTALCLPK